MEKGKEDTDKVDVAGEDIKFGDDDKTLVGKIELSVTVREDIEGMT